MNKSRAMKLQMTEFDETYSEEMAEGTLVCLNSILVSFTVVKIQNFHISKTSFLVKGMFLSILLHV